MAVGSVVPYAKAGVGAIASQAWGNPDTDRSGLNYWHPESQLWKSVNLMTSADPNRNSRQLRLLESTETHLFSPDLNAWNGQVENMEPIMRYREIF